MEEANNILADFYYNIADHCKAIINNKLADSFIHREATNNFKDLADTVCPISILVAYINRIKYQLVIHSDSFKDISMAKALHNCSPIQATSRNITYQTFFFNTD